MSNNFKFAPRKESVGKPVANSGIKDFVRSLPDDKLGWLASRLEQRFPGDLPEALAFLENHEEADKFLSLANSGKDFFDSLDNLTSALYAESRRRNSK
jgi:hypothetical protein